MRYMHGASLNFLAVFESVNLNVFQFFRMHFCSYFYANILIVHISRKTAAWNFCPEVKLMSCNLFTIVQFQKISILPPTEGIGISWGMGGSGRSKNIKKCMKLYWNFHRGGEVLEKIPSMGEVWIFSGTTHFWLLVQAHALVISWFICFQFNIRTGSYDPLDKAYKENKQLIQAYRTRMQNSNKGGRKQDVMSRVWKCTTLRIHTVEPLHNGCLGDRGKWPL